MADKDKTRQHSESNDQTEQSIFDLFEPPPDPDPKSFGKVPVVREGEIDLTDDEDDGPSAELKAAADAEAAGLQHWTAPATGQVPAVLSSESESSGLWGDVKGPSWHGDDPSWAGPDLADVFADTDAVTLAAPIDDYDDDEDDDEGYGEFEYRDAAGTRSAAPGRDLGDDPTSRHGMPPPPAPPPATADGPRNGVHPQQAQVPADGPAPRPIPPPARAPGDGPGPPPPRMPGAGPAAPPARIPDEGPAPRPARIVEPATGPGASHPSDDLTGPVPDHPRAEGPAPRPSGRPDQTAPGPRPSGHPDQASAGASGARPAGPDQIAPTRRGPATGSGDARPTGRPAVQPRRAQPAAAAPQVPAESQDPAGPPPRGARASRLGIERNDTGEWTGAPDELTAERPTPAPPPIRHAADGPVVERSGDAADTSRFELDDRSLERPSVFSEPRPAVAQGVPRPADPTVDPAVTGALPRQPVLGGEHGDPRHQAAALVDERDRAGSRRRLFTEGAGDQLPALDDIEFAGDERHDAGRAYDDGYEDEYYDDEDLDDELGLDRPGRNLPAAIAVGVGLAAVVLAAMFFGPDTTMVVVGVLSLLAVLEVYNAMRMAGLRPATLLGVVGAVATPVAAYYRGDAAFPLIVGLAVVFGVLWYLVGADTERPVLNFSLTLTGIFWIGGLASFAALMLRSEAGVELLLATIIITVASDTLAYIGGKAYGARPFHRASPNKTWEGTLTGFAAAVFAGFAIGVTEMGSIWDGNFVAVIVLGVVVGLLAPMGDLAESVVKRDLGVKDMGSLLPGHGGVMDRIDGLLFALPGAYYLALVSGVL